MMHSSKTCHLTQPKCVYFDLWTHLVPVHVTTRPRAARSVTHPFLCISCFLYLSALMMLHPWLFLRALATNTFLFLFLHHASVSVQLNLASPCIGNRPKEAAMKLKIDFQVEYRVLPPPPSSPSASRSSRFFPPFMNIYGGVSIWSWCRAKIRSQIKISPTSFPRCYFACSFLSSLSRSAGFIEDSSTVSCLTLDFGLFHLLRTHTQAQGYCILPSIHLPQMIPTSIAILSLSFIWIRLNE